MRSRKLISVVLVLAMCLTFALPTAFAAEAPVAAAASAEAPDEAAPGATAPPVATEPPADAPDTAEPTDAPDAAEPTDAPDATEPTPDVTMPPADGIDETQIVVEGSGDLSILLGEVWTALEEVDWMLLPADEPLEFRATSETAELSSVTLNGEQIGFAAVDGTRGTWEFTATLVAADSELVVRFSDAQSPVEPEEGIKITVVGPGSLEMEAEGAFVPVGTDADLEIPENEEVTFRASSDVSSLDSVTLNGADVPFEAVADEADADGAVHAWLFAVTFTSPDDELIATFHSDEVPDDKLAIVVEGDGILEMQTEDAWVPVDDSTEADVPVGEEVTFRATSETTELESVTLDGEEIAFSPITNEDDESAVIGWTFTVTFSEDSKELVVKFAEASSEDVVEIIVRGTGTLQAEIGGEWVVLDEDGDIDVPTGEAVAFRATSDAAELQSVMLDEQDVPFEDVTDEDGNACWQFTVTFVEPDSTLVVTFSDAVDELETLVSIKGTGILEMLVEDEWVQMNDGDVLSTPPDEAPLTFQASSSEAELVAVVLNGSEVPFTEVEGDEEIMARAWQFEAAITEDLGLLEIVFSDGETSAEVDVAVAILGTGVVEWQNGEDWELIEDGDTLLVTGGEPQTFRAASDAELESVRLNDEDVPFEEMPEEDGSRRWEFTTTPVAEGSELVITFADADSDIVIGDNAPEEVVFIETEDGFYLTGLEAAAADIASTVGTVSGWLEAPKGGNIVICSADGQPAEATATVGTGMLITLVDGEEVLEAAEICVTGDVLGTGILEVSQITRMAAAVNGTAPLEGAYLLAGDINESGAVDIADLVSEAGLVLADNARRASI